MGYDSDTEDKKPSLPSSPDSQMITCWLSGDADEGIRFTIRASGTEPKIKCKYWMYVDYIKRRLTKDVVYLECRAKTQAEADDAARSTLGQVGREWFSDASLTIEERYGSLLDGL